MGDIRTTPLSNDCHTQKPNFVTQKNDEGKKQGSATMALSSACVEVIEISGVLQWVKKWFVKQNKSELLILTLTASEHLLRLCCHPV